MTMLNLVYFRSMKSKLLIYIGIVTLVTGILLRVAEIAEIMGLVLIILGAALKSTYIILKWIKKDYKPGVELLFLAIGLSLFLCFRCSTHPWAWELMILGVGFKIVFVLFFIRKMRGRRF
jgi:uncharacterized membrane-anchored protein